MFDDCCPEQSGDWVAANFDHPKIIILRHSQDQGGRGSKLNIKSPKFKIPLINIIFTISNPVPGS